MDQHNFWYWLIEGIKYAFFSFIVLLPEHEHWGIASVAGEVATDLGLLMIVFLGKFIRLITFSRVVVALAIIVIARNKIRMFNAAVNLIKLLRIVI